MLDRKFGCMVGVKDGSTVAVPLDNVANRQRTIPLDNPLIKAAHCVGTEFGNH